MKNIRYLVLAAALVTISLGVVIYEYSSQTAFDRDILFQTSTIDALLEGVYDGDMTLGELRKHGDIGIGTFDDLDGEMIGLGGQFYQVKVDGVAYPVNDSMQTPFAVVTFFDSDEAVLLQESLNYTQLESHLDDILPTENIFYAIKIEGVFEYIKTRSVPRQSRPYRPLVEATKNQSTFEFHNLEGTIVGFRTPEYMRGVNVPGYHFHFITQDKVAGGHLLDCRLQRVKIEIDCTSRFYMTLPGSKEFYEADLAKTKQTELEKVEKQ